MPREPKKLPPGVRRRGAGYSVHYYNPSGTRREEAAGSDLRAAVRYRAQRVAEVEAGTWKPRSDRRPRTVAEYSVTWLEQRARKIRSAADEERWLRLHVLPRIGDMALEELRPRHVAELVEQLVDAGLSARSVRNAHGALSVMLQHAVFHEVLVMNPARDLPRGTMPRIGRSKIRAFTRAEALTLMSDERIEWPRRVLYSLALLGGMRLGEAAGRRWRDIEDREPLRALHVTTQYDDLPLKGADGEDDAARVVPIHPELERILDAWRRVGWARFFGRVPRPDDLITPGDITATKSTTRNQASKALRRDLARLGLEVEKGVGLHAARRWFITTARAGAADRDTVAEITHRPKGDVLENSYTRRAWEQLCEATLAIEITPPAPVVPLRAKGSDGGRRGGSDE